MSALSSVKANVVHEVARLGFNTTSGAELYDRARPSFPPESMSSILDSAIQASKGAPLRVMEFGAGTGISTRALLDAIALKNRTSGGSEAKVQIDHLSVYEPSPGMRDSFATTLKAKLPAYMDASVFTRGAESVDVADGTFENFPVSQEMEGTTDLILIAQAWHWAQDHQAALSNFARVLKPNGCLALIWNLEDRDAAPWVARIRDAYEQHEKGAPQYRHGRWKKMYDTKAYSSFFDALPQEDYVRILPTTKEDAWNRVHSKSYIALLGDEDLTALRKEYDAIMNDTDRNGRRWIDQDKGIFEYPYMTNLNKFVRK
ncbi:unnamed protein product [Tilletia controversa]|uniref:Methyltransferase type 11 domain-containing protein n=2 Tax=Tilletia TaxID=13289 RepID=A0A9N8QCK0_9BASI|nr:hypothetical protein CF328_g5629 [Tilletia controversa]KAE8194668.1 hypothetical protein CF335_g5290 [Tilletia laevis]CAD6929488.1 unnamed protein product [Tilletia caries]CAD6898335.1 unnamed protein product [Tilletia laevis]CAD6918059.1 unnamed protein product [Tilletia laevis]